MKKILMIVLSAALLTGVATVSHANVFAAHLKAVASGSAGSESYELSYRLNEPATSVSIEVYGPLPGTTVIRTLTGTTAKGLNTVTWDGTKTGGARADEGDYGWKVVATDSVGHTAQYDLITDDGTALDFEYPGGIAVNKSQDSDFFGCIYVVQSRDGVTGRGRSVTQGLFILNNDGTPFDSQGDTAYSGNVAWTTSVSGPIRAAVSEDGSYLYVSDWTDTHGSVWRAPSDGSGTWPAALTEAGRDAAGLCTNHGSLMPVLVEGSGASTVLYTMDEDYPNATSPQRGSIFKYNIGTAVDYADLPTVEYDDGILNRVQNYRCDMVRGNDGWWMAQNRSSGQNSQTVPALFHWNVTSATEDFNSGVTTLDMNEGYGALAKSPDGNTIYLSSYGATGQLHVINVTGFPGTAPTRVTYFKTSTSSAIDYGRDVKTDAAGNFFVVMNICELLRGFSPNSGANSFTTNNPTSQKLTLAEPPATPTPSTSVSPEYWQQSR